MCNALHLKFAVHMFIELVLQTGVHAFKTPLAPLTVDITAILLYNIIEKRGALLCKFQADLRLLFIF